MRLQSGFHRALRGAALCLGSLALASPAASARQEGGTFVFCFEASPEGFDSARSLTLSSYNAVTDPLYGRLLGFAPDGAAVVPELARSWETAQDGRQFTFHLRPGVKWHQTGYFKPSRELDADDVILSLDRLRRKDHPFNKAYGWSEYPYTKTYATNIKRLEKIDPLTVRVTLEKPDAAFLANLAMPVSIIISAEYAGQLIRAGRLADINVKPIGTGPFRFRRYEKDAQIRYDAHPDYYAGRARFDQLIYAIVRDSATRLQKLRAGECHLSISPKPQEIALVEADPRLKLMETTGISTGFLAFNTRKKPLDNADVRRALSLAINRKALFDSVFHSSAREAAGMLPPFMLGHDEKRRGIAHDPETAKALLKKAGIPPGFEIELWAMPIARSYNPDGRKFAEMIQADWAKVGIKAKIVTYEWGDYIRRAHAGEHQVISLGWSSDNGDPDNLLVPLLSCARQESSLSRWCHAGFEARLEKGRYEQDAKKRAALYRELEGILAAELPILPIAHGVFAQPMRREVEGYRVTPLGRTFLHGVSLAPASPSRPSAP
ncbi:MAG: ABC transporter substrate-binding protein [Candidatus Accumulibacter sp.]|jgi:dipeptide transport system substrate-binding protein|nr:ABC transporter substrate-binding protein [Accumulibacter sp.]